MEAGLSATVSLCIGGDPACVPKRSSMAVQASHILTILHFLIPAH